MREHDRGAVKSIELCNSATPPPAPAHCWSAVWTQVPSLLRLLHGGQIWLVFVSFPPIAVFKTIVDELWSGCLWSSQLQALPVQIAWLINRWNHTAIAMRVGWLIGVKFSAQKGTFTWQLLWTAGGKCSRFLLNHEHLLHINSNYWKPKSLCWVYFCLSVMIFKQFELHKKAVLKIIEVLFPYTPSGWIFAERFLSRLPLAVV